MNDPTTLTEIYAQHDYWRQRLDRARKRRDAAERTIERCYRHMGSVEMVEQVAALLQRRFPQYNLRVLGPFGLANEVSIHVEDPTVPEEQARKCAGAVVGSISFRLSSDHRLTVVDRTRNTGRYPSNTIGSINGFNYPEVEAPEIDGLETLLWASINKVETSLVGLE